MSHFLQVTTPHPHKLSTPQPLNPLNSLPLKSQPLKSQPLQPFNPQPRSTQVLGLNTFLGKWLQQSVPIQQSEFINFQG